MKELQVTFTKERDTKNTVRYQEVVADGDPQVVGTIYLQKFAVKDLGSPEKLLLTITAG